MRPLHVFAMALLLGTSGCATVVTRYYTLSQVDPAGPAAAPASDRVAAPPSEAGAARLIGIGPVELPDYVDIPQIVVRTGNNTLDQAAFDQWGGSLDDMVPRVLVENLAARMRSDHFVTFPQAGDLPFDYRVPIVLSRFDVTTAGEATIVARWQMRGKPGSGALSVHETTARAQAAGKTYGDRVEALSKALGILTDEIAAALTATARDDGAKPKKAKKR